MWDNSTHCTDILSTNSYENFSAVECLTRNKQHDFDDDLQHNPRLKYLTEILPLLWSLTYRVEALSDDARLTSV